MLKVAKQGLEADKITRFKDGSKFKDPDYYARHQYLETALRIRNLAQTAETPLGDINIQVINYADSKPIKSVQTPSNDTPINIGDANTKS